MTSHGFFGGIASTWIYLELEGPLLESSMLEPPLFEPPLIESPLLEPSLIEPLIVEKKSMILPLPMEMTMKSDGGDNENDLACSLLKLIYYLLQ
ncbi:hypothetical protein YC2023_044171 [Brassica napus]